MPLPPSINFAQSLESKILPVFHVSGILSLAFCSNLPPKIMNISQGSILRSSVHHVAIFYSILTAHYLGHPHVHYIQSLLCFSSESMTHTIDLGNLSQIYRFPPNAVNDIMSHISGSSDCGREFQSFPLDVSHD
jgi:hypothetical protein